MTEPMRDSMATGSDGLHDPHRLEVIREADLLNPEPDESLDRIARLAARILNAPLALVNFVDDRRQFSRSCIAPPDWAGDREVLLQDSFCKNVVLSGEPLLIEDAEASPLVASSRMVTKRGIRSYLGLPVRSTEGHVLGTLCVADFVPRAWSKLEVEILGDLAAGVMSEISLRRQLRAHHRVEEALRAAKEEAEQANRAKSRFLSRVSHELRTPMNAILGFAQILEMDLAEADDRESAQEILRAGRHLLALIDEVLDIARIEAGRLSLAIEPVSVPELFQESVALTRRGAMPKQISLETQIETAPERFVWADPHRLKQVLLNLLSNAIKYNRVGGTVVLSSEDREDGWLRISVRDTGPGIPADLLERLFTPFERLGAERGGVSGTGLGLAVSKALVEAMGGRIGVETVEGEGSDFWVELPQPDPDQGGSVEAPGESGTPEKLPHTHTVLLVEDNLANARLIGHVLERRGNVRLLTAIQGRRALDLAREHPIDLVILDVNLPDIAGDEVLMHFQSDPLLRKVPVVMISGGADEFQIDELLTRGARAFLKKPFAIQELLQVVDTHLQRVDHGSGGV